MSFYRDSKGNTCKVLETASYVVLMFPWSTRFFCSSRDAYKFLIANGFTF